MTNYVPSDIKSPALRRIYDIVQKSIADRYEKALKAAHDKAVARDLTARFNREIQDTINYYVNMQ